MTPTNQQQKTPGNTPGFPPIDEQEAYWREKERLAARHSPEKLIAAVDIFASFLGDLNAAIGKLRVDIEKLTK